MASWKGTWHSNVFYEIKYAYVQFVIEVYWKHVPVLIGLHKHYTLHSVKLIIDSSFFSIDRLLNKAILDFYPIIFMYSLLCYGELFVQIQRQKDLCKTFV